MLLLLAVVVGTVLPLAIGPAPAAAQSDAEDGEVTCPASLDGVPLDLEEEFAGTPRALANDAGVLVRFTLLCPYRRASGASVADLTLSWSKYAAEDLSCDAVELTSEPADDGRIQGLVDHPSRSAQVTFGAASSSVLPAVDEVATELLADVPSDAYPCVGGAETTVDADVAPVSRETSSSVGVALAVLVLGASAVIGVVVVLVARRSKRRRPPAAPTSEPQVGALAAALRARQQVAAASPAGHGGAPSDRHPAADPITAAAAERQNAVEILAGATALQMAIEARLVEARSDIAVHRVHADAVRRLAGSVRVGKRAEFLSSYAGVITLAVAGTNLVSTSARRAASLVATAPTDQDPTVAWATELEALHRRVLAAAEVGLDDTRYWLWQDRRLAVMDALGVIGRLAPRLVAAQERLARHVAELARQHQLAGEEAAWARGVIADADHRLGQAPPDASSTTLERAGV